MKKNITQISELYSKSRTTIYRHIEQGKISQDADGMIDLSEAIRVYGEPVIKRVGRIDTKSSASHDTIQDVPFEKMVRSMEQQISLLQQQVSIGLEREKFYQNQIETMQRLLEAPKPVLPEFSVEKESEHSEIQPSENEVKADIPESLERSSEPLMEEDVVKLPKISQPKKEKRGLFGRMVKSMFDS